MRSTAAHKELTVELPPAGPPQGAAREAPLECPRCDYDLSAMPPSWQTWCPIDGRCSECGLEFQWGELLKRDEPAPEWMFERQPSGGFWTSTRRLFRTWINVLRPWWFWSNVRLFHAVAKARLCMLLALSFVLVHQASMLWVVYSISVAPGGGRARPNNPSGSTIPWASVKALLVPFDDILRMPWFWIPIASAAVSPLVFLAVPDTLSHCRVKPRHIFRAGVYGLLGVCTIMFLFRAVRVTLVLNKTIPPSGPVSFWDAFVSNAAFKTSWAMVASIVWLAAFWYFAIKRYLRLTHPAGVAAAVIIIACLTGIAVAAHWPGSTLLLQRFDPKQVFWWRR